MGLGAAPHLDERTVGVRTRLDRVQQLNQLAARVVWGHSILSFRT
jgi:hypothetical protein